MTPRKILMTGATGLVGRELGKALVQRGHELIVVSRSRRRAEETLNFPAHIIEGDLTHEILHDAHLKKVDAVIHLMGESVAGGRWSTAQKNRIYNSRVKSLQNLIASLHDDRGVRTFISTSATGFYGDRGDETLKEDSARGQDFLSQVCQDWEAPVTLAKKNKTWPDLRTVILRLGVVLSAGGGALEKMMGPFQWGVAGKIADGKQWMSWIHIDDLVSLFVRAVEDEGMEGVYNAVSPEPVTNAEFSKTLAACFKHRLGPPIPRFFLKAALGEMSQILTGSQRVFPQRLWDNGFTYEYPNLEGALKNLCSPSASGDSVFVAEQYIPRKPEEIFPFFADAHNLEKLTPPLLNFQITAVSTNEVRRGTEIEYKLKIHGVPLKWLTVIETWEPNREFVDNQVKGPYEKWHHTHSFIPLGAGTLMRDTVRYRLPLGKLGKLGAGYFVGKDVEKIFTYRRAVIPRLLKESV